MNTGTTHTGNGGPEDRPADGEAAPQIETAEGHTGSDHVSHGANSNLTPAAATSGDDAAAAREIEQQHRGEEPT